MRLKGVSPILAGETLTAATPPACFSCLSVSFSVETRDVHAFVKVFSPSHDSPGTTRPVTQLDDDYHVCLEYPHDCDEPVSIFTGFELQDRRARERTYQLHSVQKDFTSCPTRGLYVPLQNVVGRYPLPLFPKYP